MPRTLNDSYVRNQVYSFIPDATDELLISSKPCWVSWVTIFHLDATPVYVKLYNKATAAAETDTPALRFGCPANAVAANGAGSNIILNEPIYFSAGLSVRAVSGIADNNDGALTASEVLINIGYSTE